MKVRSRVNKKPRGTYEPYDRNNEKNRRGERRKKVVYVTSIVSKIAVFQIAGEARESRYSYGVPIVPYVGTYYVKVDGKRVKMDANELTDYYVVLNVPKDEELLDDLTPGKLVVKGVKDDDIVVFEG